MDGGHGGGDIGTQGRGDMEIWGRVGDMGMMEDVGNWGWETQGWGTRGHRNEGHWGGRHLDGGQGTADGGSGDVGTQE